MSSPRPRSRSCRRRPGPASSPSPFRGLEEDAETEGADTLVKERLRIRLDKAEAVSAPEQQVPAQESTVNVQNLVKPRAVVPCQRHQSVLAQRGEEGEFEPDVVIG